MKQFNKKLNRKVGRAPGDLTYFGEETRRETKIRLIQYNKDKYDRQTITELSQLEDITYTDKITWIDIEGFEDTETIKSLSRIFNIHDLAVEDAFNTDHIPKYDEGEDYILFVLKSFSENKTNINVNQVTLLLKNNIVISYQEEPNSILLAKIDRIENSKGRARTKKADYLFFVLLDAFIDSYYNFFESLREETHKLDEKILLESSKNHIEEIYNLKNKLTAVRKNLFPLKTAINELLTDESELIDEDNYKYFNDCKDHVNELTEYYNSFGEIINNLIILNENNLNSSTNKIMKLLTIISTIFIPLTFIAGIYGMNFRRMPELEWEYGYFFTISLMLIIGITILVIMKRKKWL